MYIPIYTTNTRQVTFVKNHQTFWETSNMTKISSQSLKKPKYHSNTTKFSDFDAITITLKVCKYFCHSKGFEDIYFILGILALFYSFLVLLKFILKF